MSGHVSRDLHLVHHSLYTQNGDAAVRNCCIYMNIKALLRRKNPSLLYLGNSNQNKIYEILTNDMFLQVKANPMQL